MIISEKIRQAAEDLRIKMELKEAISQLINLRVGKGEGRMKTHIKKRIGQTREKIEKLQTKIHDREKDLRRDGKGIDKVVEKWEMDAGALEAELDYWKYFGKF